MPEQEASPDIIHEVTEPNSKIKSKPPWLLYVLTFFSQLSLLNQGYDMGASSGAIMLAEDIDYLHLNQLWKQLVTAGPMPSAALCCLIGSFLSDKFGRKKTMMIDCVCYILGSVITGSAMNREIIIVGRLLIGCGIGISAASTAVYVAESSPSHLRGRLIGVSQPFLTIGILFGNVVAGAFSYDKVNGWRYIWGIQGVFAFIQFVGLCFLPESPRWFIQKSCQDEANKSLIRIRSRSNVQKELQEIEKNFKEMQIDIQKKGPENLFIKMLKTQSVRRALMVGCGIQVFSQLSGVNTIIYYSGMIIQMSGIGNKSNALWNSVSVNFVSLLFSIIGVWLVDKTGRRKLAIIGLLGLFFSSLFLGTSFLMIAKHSPSINPTNTALENGCSTYSFCDDCTRDKRCGFCYSDSIEDVINGSCLSVSDATNLFSKTGWCNSSEFLSKYSTKWALNYCPTSFSWVIMIGLTLFLAFYAPGMGPLPWTINAEIYPMWARSLGNGFGAITCWIFNAIVSVTFLSFIEMIQTYGVFYLMSVVALIGSIFCFFFLPETKNKSLEEIQNLFLMGKNIWEK